MTNRRRRPGSDAVQLPVLVPQGVDEGVVVGGRAGHMLDETGGRVTAALLVQPGPQPAEQAGEVAAREWTVQVAHVPGGPLEELGGEEVAQRVGREIAD